MTRLIRSELLKLTTMRLTYGLLAVAAALTALFSLLENDRAGASGTGVPPIFTPDGLITVTTVTGFAMLFAAVLGSIVANGEFRHSTATLTYLATPRRARVLAAKTVAAVSVGSLFGLVARIISTGVGLIFVAAHSDHVALSTGALIGHVAGAAVGAALLAALGVAVGSLVRSQLATVIGIFVWAIIIESVIGGLYTTIRPYLPYTTATTLAGAVPPYRSPPPQRSSPASRPPRRWLRPAPRSDGTSPEKTLTTAKARRNVRAEPPPTPERENRPCTTRYSSPPPCSPPLPTTASISISDRGSSCRSSSSSPSSAPRST
jgi:ABC-type transport system involved in multi-copper enzyme maturation permease subunit